MTNKERLYRLWSCFTKEFVFDEMENRKLIIEVDAFNHHIYWLVKENEVYKDFLEDFNAALDYYCKEEN